MYKSVDDSSVTIASTICMENSKIVVQSHVVQKKINQLSKFIPCRIIKNLSIHEAEKSNAGLKRVEEINGGIIFFDLVQFTVLTSALAGEKGSAGSEMLQELLRGYFNANIEIIRSYGGSVYQFAGDSALVGFEKEESESDELFAIRICSCALLMKEKTDLLPQRMILGKNFKILTKISVSAGKYQQVLMGDPQKLLNLSIIGETVKRATSSEKYAKPNDIIIDTELYKRLGKLSSVEPINDAHYRLLNLQERKNGEYEIELKINYSGSMLSKISHFISPLLIERFSDESEQFMGEFRNVTSVFIAVQEQTFNNETHQSRVRLLNELFILLQGISDVHGGTLVQTDLSDKGTVFLVLFGAPLANENKEELAVRFSYKFIQSTENKLTPNSISIGVSTGTNYCGILGADIRKGYTVLGESVNLASRLMTSVVGSGICIDEATASKVDKIFQIKKVEGKTLKGLEDSLEFYSVEGEIERGNDLSGEDASFIIIGREKELAYFSQKAEDVAKEKSSLILALRGDIGIGKTHLIKGYKNIVLERKFKIAEGLCYRYESNTAYFVWQKILKDLILSGADSNINQSLLQIESTLEKHKIDKDWAPALASIMGISIAERDLTKDLDPAKKNHRILEIIWEILSEKSQETPVLLIIDDYQWADESSIDLLNYILSKGANSLMVIVSVRLGGDLSRFEAYENFSVLELSDLDKDGCRKYLKEKMLIEEIDPALEEQIITNSHGNPFFLESLILSMRESGQFQKEKNGNYRQTGTTGDMSIPQSLQDVILLRIEKLNERAQTVLKTAAVIGKNFEYDTIMELCSENLQPELSTYLREIQNQNFTDMESQIPPIYFFKHLMTRDIAYNLMLLSTRKELHLKFGEILEKKYKENLEQQCENIAYHFLQSDDTEKKLKFLLLSARKAKKQYSNNDALYYYRQILTLFKESNINNESLEFLTILEELSDVYLQSGQYTNAIETYSKILSQAKDKATKSRLLTGIGKAYQEKGEVKAAIENLEEALKYVGLRVPGNKAYVIVKIVKELAVNFLQTLFPGMFFNPKGKKRENIVKQLNILPVLEKIYYFYDLEKMLWTTLKETSLAERIKESKYLALTYGNYGLMLMSLGLKKRAKHFYEKSLLYMEDCNDAVTKAVTLQRYGIQGMYLNDPDLWFDYMKKSSSIFKEVGEVWELLASMSTMAIAQFYKSDFSRAIEIYRNVEKLATENDAKMYLGWANTTIPFCSYIQGRTNAEETMEGLRKGLHYGDLSHDLANRCAIFGLMCQIMVREKNISACVELAEKTYQLIARYKVNIPHMQIAFVNASEAALAALMSGEKVPVKKLEKIVKNGLSKAEKFGKIMPYIKGPAIRGRAIYNVYKGKSGFAKSLFEKSIIISEENPNEWEKGLAYMSAATYIPEKKEIYFAKAREIFEKNGLLVELNRLKEI